MNVHVLRLIKWTRSIKHVRCIHIFYGTDEDFRYTSSNIFVIYIFYQTKILGTHPLIYLFSFFMRSLASADINIIFFVIFKI